MNHDGEGEGGGGGCTDGVERFLCDKLKGGLGRQEGVEVGGEGLGATGGRNDGVGSTCGPGGVGVGVRAGREWLGGGGWGTAR